MADRPRPWLATLAYAIAAVVILIDQASKYWILSLLGGREGVSIPVLPFFHLTMVWNRGVSFGLFSSPEGQEVGRWLLAVFSAVVAVFLAIWVRRQNRPVLVAGIGLIIGGALGNLADRIRWGAVADFLDFGPVFPWVFNVADAAINVGVACILIDAFLFRDRSGSAAQTPT